MSNKKIQLKIDNDLCTRCGTCAMVYPDYFKMKDDGSINHKNALIPEEEVEEIKNICPVQAIVKDKTQVNENAE